MITHPSFIPNATALVHRKVSTTAGLAVWTDAGTRGN